MCTADTDLPCQLWAAYDQIKVKSEVAQLCPTLCDPMDCSLSGSSIHGIFPGKSAGVDCHFLLQGIFQARVLEWIAISFSFPSPGDLPNPGIEPGSPALQADALPSEPPGKPKGYR